MANLLGGHCVNRVAHGALRLGCRVVLREQRPATWPVAFLWPRYVSCGNLDRAGSGSVVCQGMRHARRSGRLPVPRRMDDHSRCAPRLVETSQRRCRPNVRVPVWQSTQRISQFESVPGRFRLRWLASHFPGPLPLPLFFRLNRLLHRVGGPCDLRLHSQCPSQRSQAAWMTAGENSKSAAMGRV